MKAFTYIKKGEFAFVEKAKPAIKDAKDAIVRVTMSRHSLLAIFLPLDSGQPESRKLRKKIRFSLSEQVLREFAVCSVPY